jgi:hypothetical protein
MYSSYFYFMFFIVLLTKIKKKKKKSYVFNFKKKRVIALHHCGIYRPMSWILYHRKYIFSSIIIQHLMLEWLLATPSAYAS